MSQTHTTKAIILKTVAYGDTSLIVTALTELFGMQTYMVKGVRKSTKTQSTKASFFQLAAHLEMVVYHNPLKQINFVKEFRWQTMYQSIYQNVVRNSIALFTIELLQKTIKEPDSNPELFYFVEDVLQAIDVSNNSIAANLPIYIALHLPNLFGIQIIDDYNSNNHNILDLKEGCFTNELPLHNNIVNEPHSKNISDFLKALHPNDLEGIALNGKARKEILDYIEIFYLLHVSDFGKIKTLPILREILG
jgi:DNA repair protein RecO (recombination protein O)